jgi:hypothetical protein
MRLAFVSEVLKGQLMRIEHTSGFGYPILSCRQAVGQPGATC